MRQKQGRAQELEHEMTEKGVGREAEWVADCPAWGQRFSQVVAISESSPTGRREVKEWKQGMREIGG